MRAKASRLYSHYVALRTEDYLRADERFRMHLAKKFPSLRFGTEQLQGWLICAWESTNKGASMHYRDLWAAYAPEIKVIYGHSSVADTVAACERYMRREQKDT